MNSQRPGHFANREVTPGNYWIGFWGGGPWGIIWIGDKSLPLLVSDPAFDLGLPARNLTVVFQLYTHL
jgi:hypothetical protein